MAADNRDVWLASDNKDIFTPDGLGGFTTDFKKLGWKPPEPRTNIHILVDGVAHSPYRSKIDKHGAVYTDGEITVTVFWELDRVTSPIIQIEDKITYKEEIARLNIVVGTYKEMGEHLLAAAKNFLDSYDKYFTPYPVEAELEEKLRSAINLYGDS